MRKSSTVGLIAALLLAIPAGPSLAGPASRRNEDVLRALQPADPERFTFMVVGDSRGGLPILARLLKQMEADRPLFVAYTGDLVGVATPATYRAALAVLTRSPLRIVHVMGNHDWQGGGDYLFRETFGDPHYTFEVGNNRFIALDTSHGYVTDEQLRWLDAALQTDKRKFVMAHVPPVHGPYERSVFYPNAGKFKELMARRKAAFGIFSHMHLFDHFSSNGTQYVISGGGGAPLYDFLPRIAKDSFADYHYVRFQVSPEGVTFKPVRLAPVAVPTR